MKYNRIKEVIIEQGKTNNWLAKELGVTHVSVSRWCSNMYQPSIENLYKIAEALKVSVRELLIEKH